MSEDIDDDIYVGGENDVSDEALDEEYIADEDTSDDDDEDEWIEIRESDYEELERRSKKLMFLETAGVENWDGYDNAMEDMANFEEDVDE